MNEKDIDIDSLTIFNRPVFESELESTLEDSLRFNNEQMIRKANKAVFWQYLKNFVDCTVTSSNPSSPLIIGGMWMATVSNNLIHRF